MPIIWTNDNDTEIGPADWRLRDARKVDRRWERLERVTGILVWGIFVIGLVILAAAIWLEY
jgi:hypothetical protein